MAAEVQHQAQAVPESAAQDLREQRAALVPLGQVAVAAEAHQTLAAMVALGDREP